MADVTSHKTIDEAGAEAVIDAAEHHAREHGHRVVIAVVELSKQYQILTKSGAGYAQVALVTAGLYLVMSVPLGHLSRYLEKRWNVA